MCFTIAIFLWNLTYVFANAILFWNTSNMYLNLLWNLFDKPNKILSFNLQELQKLEVVKPLHLSGLC